MVLESIRMSDSKDNSDISDSGYPTYMWHGPGSAVFRKSEKVANSDDGKSRGEVAEIAFVVGKLLVGVTEAYCRTAGKMAKEAENVRWQRGLEAVAGGRPRRSRFGPSDFDS